MRENYQFREIEKKEVKNIVDLVRKSFERDYLILSIYKAKGIEKFIISEFENKFSPYKYFVLTKNNKIIGYTEFKIYDKVAFLNIIAVSQLEKNKGVGRKIINFSKEYFIKNSFNSIQLDVFRSNNNALYFYEKYGFYHIDTLFFYSLNLYEDKKCLNNIYIQNYPHFKEINNIFDFYFIDLKKDKTLTKFGVINNNLFIRGFHSKEIDNYITSLSNKMGFDKIYFIGEKCKIEGYKFIDNIMRMEMKI